MKAADTNVLVRVITADDTHQAAFAEEWLATGAWVSNLVLLELSWVLASVYRFPKGDLADALEAVLEMPGVSVEDEATLRAALATFRGASANVDFADCLILQTAARAGHGPLGTFDAALGKLRGAQRLKPKASAGT